MNVGSLRRVPSWAIAFLVTGAACSTSCASHEAPNGKSHEPKEHVVLVRAEKQSNGKKKGVAYPNHLPVRGYSQTAPDSVVIWSYRFPSLRIKFKPSDPAIPDPRCDDSIGECRLPLPPGLKFRTQYPYTISGSDADGPFEDNDPEIEVDR